MSVFTSFLKWFAWYLILGMTSYYTSMFVYFLALILAIPLTAFGWISSHLFPVSDFVIILYYSLIFIMIFKLVQSLYLKISN